MLTNKRIEEKWTGISIIDQRPVVLMNQTIFEVDGVKAIAATGHQIIEPELYEEHKTIVEKDIAAFYA